MAQTSFDCLFCTDTNDFDATTLDATFPADEVMNIADLLLTIPIVDDEIDEALEQVFIIVLEVLRAVNADLITITRNTSFGRIIDNDGEILSAFTYSNKLVFPFPLIAIQIGFAQPVYSLNEPDFETINRDIILVREGGRLSEQTFQVTVSVSGTTNIPAATLQFQFEDDNSADYRLQTGQDFVQLGFSPFQQNITLIVFLLGDNLPEGTEAFQATSTPSQNFPNFGPPSMGGAFASTNVLIIDDGCKFACRPMHA